MSKKRVLIAVSWLFLFVSVFLGGTPKQVFAGESELVPPVPGGYGGIGIMGKTEDTIGVTWQPARDNLSSPENITYYVFLSKDHDLSFMANCETYGILQNPGGTKNLTQYNITGLEAGTRYYINIVIADQAGNKAAYAGTYSSTSRKLTPLTAGDNGKITLTPVSGQRVRLQWAPVVSENTSPDKVTYYVFKSESPNILQSENSDPPVMTLDDVTSCYLDVPAAGTIYFTVAALSSGFSPAYYQEISRTFPNSLPVRKPGIGSSTQVKLKAGTSYQIALDQLFEDRNGDSLQYLVSVNGSGEQAVAASYSYTPQTQGTTTTLTFKAADFEGASADTYSVTLVTETPPVATPEVTPQPPTPQPPAAQPPVVAFQTGSTFTVSGYRYLVTSADDQVRLLSYTGRRSSISIPSTVTRNGVVFRVTAIGSKAFYKKNITSVSIPDSVIAVGKNAFASCKRLRSVSFGRNVSEIHSGAFSKTYSLQKLTFKADKLPKISKKVFSGSSERISVKATSKIRKYSRTLKKVFKTAGITNYSLHS